MPETCRDIQLLAGKLSLLNGQLISFEGLDGVGKSTQINLLQQALSSRGIEVLSLREPGGTSAGEALRSLIKAGTFHSPLAELLAFETARAELVSELVRPALARGAWVLLDRFADSSLAYQGALGKLDMELIRKLNTIATGGLKPGLTVLLALDPAQALLRRRGAEKPAAGGGNAESTELDSIEKRDTDYFSRVHDIFSELARAEPQRFLVLDASQDVDAIHRQVMARVQEMDGGQHG